MQKWDLSQHTRRLHVQMQGRQKIRWHKLWMSTSVNTSRASGYR